MAAAIVDYFLELTEVSKKFDRNIAVNNVSFHVERNEVFALLGPNGAGKTTIANLVIGNLTPDSGKIVYHLEQGDRQVPDRKHVGYFPGDCLVYRTLGIGRLLFHSACKRGLYEHQARQVTAHWLERVGLAQRADTALMNLSKGNQQKVQFAEAVLHNPVFTFFDEPFSSLDPVNQELFITMIRELQASGMTILVADHNMQLVERVASRMLIINRGHQLAFGTLEELREQAQAGIRIRVRLADPRVAVDLNVLARHPGIRQLERTAGGEIRLMTRTGINPVEVLNFIKTQMRISEILSEPASLHDIYVHLVNKDNESENGEHVVFNSK